MLAPEGVSAKKEALGIGLGLLASALWSLTAAGRIGAEWESTLEQAAKGQVVTLTGFRGLLGGALDGFYFVAAAMVLLAVWHYAKIRKDSPSPGEKVHLRAMAMPVAGVLLALCVSLILYAAYHGVFSENREKLNEMINRPWEAVENGGGDDA